MGCNCNNTAGMYWSPFSRNNGMVNTFSTIYLLTLIGGKQNQNHHTLYRTRTQHAAAAFFTSKPTNYVTHVQPDDRTQVTTVTWPLVLNVLETQTWTHLSTCVGFAGNNQQLLPGNKCWLVWISVQNTTKESLQKSCQSVPNLYAL